MQKQKADIEETVRPIETVFRQLLYLEDSLSILNEEEGEIFFEEIKKEADELKKSLEIIELKLLLSGDVDKNNAIVTIHPGAGGIESQDWAQ
ncbi:MAG: PCRF domain-containing protein, partial [Nitrospirae bacterium]|nr:PCRF domain-containing protein [Nitrospirota bacterium]